MKAKLLTLIITSLMVINFTIAKTITISTSNNFTFTPDSITITEGDSIQFNIGSGHNAIEVSESTWLSNGNTPSGGFSRNSSGIVANLSVGIHYYICTPHASMSMKGKIVVTSSVGIFAHKSLLANRIYPNPTKNNFTIELSGNEKSIKIYNLVGSVIAEYTNLGEGKFLLNALENKPTGAYFIAITTKESAYNYKLIKE